MGRDTGRLREEVIRRLLAAGAVGVGIAEAGRVSDAAYSAYMAWLDSGRASGMDYMHNHKDLRRDPRLLLSGARSVITMAFSYRGNPGRDPELPVISSYAFLPDYHNALRGIVGAAGIPELLGAEHRDWRLCVDSAPVMERYWAVESGLGHLCDNGTVSVGNAGSEVILAEILTTEAFEPTAVLAEGEGEVCDHCGACLRACPTGALKVKGAGFNHPTEPASRGGERREGREERDEEAREEEGRVGTEIDCDLCLSYLTIEHRGEWEDERHRAAMSTPAGRRTLFGCDRCIAACHLNRQRSDCRPFAEPLPGIATLTGEDLLLYDDEVKARLRGSCLKRAREAGLKRNARGIED